MNQQNTADAPKRAKRLFVPPPPSPEDLLSLDEVMQITRLGKTSIYRRMQEGQFPLPLKLGGRAVRWTRGSITAWRSSQPTATYLPVSGRVP